MEHNKYDDLDQLLIQLSFEAIRENTIFTPEEIELINAIKQNKKNRDSEYTF